MDGSPDCPAHLLELGVFVIDVIGFVVLLFAELYNLIREVYQTVVKTAGSSAN